MLALPIPRSSTPGARPGEGEGRLVNCYAVREGGRDYVRRSRGLAVAARTPGRGLRGLLRLDGACLAVFADRVCRVPTGPDAGPAVDLAGGVPGADAVLMARNSRTTDGVPTPDVVAVRSGGGAYLLAGLPAGGAVAPLTSAGLPAEVTSVSFLDGYFLFTAPDGRIFASELNSTEVKPLSFATAESSADGLLRGVACGAMFYALGTATIEFWKNVGASPFPLQRAATALAVGVRGALAVAGDVAGWGHQLYVVASDGTVRALAGYDDTVISTPDVERFVAAAAPDELRMTAHVEAGRAFVTLSGPAGTWCYDVRAGAWHERASRGLARWRVHAAVADEAGGWLFGDLLSGDLLAHGPDCTEPGAPLDMVVETGPLAGFPARVAVPALFADFTAADARVEVAWSMDGGRRFSRPVARSLAGADRMALRVNRLGLSTHHGLRVRFTSDAAADFTFLGAAVAGPQIRGREAG